MPKSDMSAAAHAGTRRILNAKPITRFILKNRYGTPVAEFSETEYARAKTLQYCIAPHNHSNIMERAMAGSYPRGNVDSIDIIIPATKIKTIELVKIGDKVITPAEFKNLKREIRLVVNFSSIIGRSVTFTRYGIRAGCQYHSWRTWERRGKRIIKDYNHIQYRPEVASELLKWAIENKTTIRGKLGT